MQYTADAEKIRRWREERHWSQEHLAALAGIGVRTVQRIETGDKASRETLSALAAAFNVDVMALMVDVRADTATRAQREREKAAAGLRLSFWIHLASYLFGMLVFAGISVGSGPGFVMMWPAIWWTVGLAGHGLAVVIVQLAQHYEQQFGTDETIARRR